MAAVPHSSASTIALAAMLPAHWPEVQAIYCQGIATGHATFETDAPTWEAWDRQHLPTPRLVALGPAGILGWAALSPVSGRYVYRGVAEVSVYVAETARGQGVGRALLGALVSASEADGIWTLQAGIFPENTASIALHRACGFRIVGVRQRLGQMGGGWRDVALLERRSATVGV